MSIDRAYLVRNIVTFVIVIFIQTHPYVYVQRGSIFPYNSYMFCLATKILLTPQLTGTKHEDGTTLRVQPYRTAAVVGYIMYMLVASPRYSMLRRVAFVSTNEGTTLNRTTIKTIQRNFS